jgi:hypothetical protein
MHVMIGTSTVSVVDAGNPRVNTADKPAGVVSDGYRVRFPARSFAVRRDGVLGG